MSEHEPHQWDMSGQRWQADERNWVAVEAPCRHCTRSKRDWWDIGSHLLAIVALVAVVAVAVWDLIR